MPRPRTGRRVLVTGVGTFWGGRLAQALERDTTVEAIVGLDVNAPEVPLERTEFVRADSRYSILARIVKATRVDTILHTFLAVDSTRMPAERLHEINVIGTMNMLAAASAPDSTVRKIVVKSSALVYGSAAEDPMWLSEDARRSSPARTRVERSLIEVEEYLREFMEDHPATTVTVLRFSNVLGTELVTPITKALHLPVTPSIAGFDPLLQFVEEGDVVRSLVFSTGHDLPGFYNVAGDGRLPWSEVTGMCHRRRFPLPPYFTGLVTGPMAALGVVELPAELLELLRFGRGIDNRKLKEAGFRYRYTSAGAVKAFAEAMRWPELGAPERGDRYEQHVESFLRHSPAVVREGADE